MIQFRISYKEDASFMLRIDRRISVIISYCFCALAFIGVLVLGILIACNQTVFPNTFDGMIFIAQNRHGLWTYLLEYSILILVLLSDAVLVLLLRNVQKGEIFTSSSIGYLRIISWASILAGLAAIPLCFLLRLISVLCVAFIGFFLGVVLRVVKNVIEEGSVIKEENDSTI